MNNFAMRGRDKFFFSIGTKCRVNKNMAIKKINGAEKNQLTNVLKENDG